MPGSKEKGGAKETDADPGIGMSSLSSRYRRRAMVGGYVDLLELEKNGYLLPSSLGMLLETQKYN